MIPWGQVAIKAAISGLLIAAASELARRSPGWGALVASLPLTALLALVWLWRETHDSARAASFMAGTALYVAAALPVFALMAFMLKRNAGFGLTLGTGIALALASTAALIAYGRDMGWPA